MKNWKRYLAAALAALLLGALCACGQPGLAGQEEAVLRLAYPEIPATLDPALVSSDVERTLVSHLFENLMKPTAGGAMPGVAKAYTCTDNADGTETYTFTLRSGVKWSDGTEVTARDFVYAWRRLAAEETKAPNSAILSVVAGYDQAADGSPEALGIHAPDELTLVVDLNCHCPYFITCVCTDASTMPVQKTAAERPGWAQRQSTLCTNGAYAVTAWTKEGLTMSLNEEYYDARRMPLDTLAFTFAENADRVWELCQAGEADFGAGVAPTEETLAMARSGSAYLIINSMADTLRREGIRQALSLVIDRNAMVAQLGQGYVAAQGLIPEGVHVTSGEMVHFREANGPLVDNDPEHYADNCAAAKTALSSISRGISASLYLGTVTILCKNTPVQQRAALQVQKFWQEQLGLTVIINAVAAEDWQEALTAGEFAVALMVAEPAASDAMEYLQNFATDSEKNYGLYSLKAFDMLMRTAAQSTSAEARDAYLEDAERLLMESYYVIPLYGRETYGWLSPDYTGVFDNGLGQCFFTGVTEAETT